MVRTRSGGGAGAIAGGKEEAGAMAGRLGGGRGRIWVAAGAIRMLLIAYAVWHDSSCEEQHPTACFHPCAVAGLSAQPVCLLLMNQIVLEAWSKITLETMTLAPTVA